MNYKYFGEIKNIVKEVKEVHREMKIIKKDYDEFDFEKNNNFLNLLQTLARFLIVLLLINRKSGKIIKTIKQPIQLTSNNF
jgi:hypothetical protein